jgi:hypothetical protein
MSTPLPVFRIGYLTGSVGAGHRSGQPDRSGSINFLVYNRGFADGFAAAEVIRWASFPKTEIVWRSDPVLVRPTEGALIEFLTESFDGHRYWARLVVTEETLVPSIEFVVVDDFEEIIDASERQIGYYGPNDLVKFQLPVRPPGTVEVPPTGQATEVSP